jgi:hypothetical protein
VTALYREVVSTRAHHNESDESPCDSMRSYAIQLGDALNIPLSFPKFIPVLAVYYEWLVPEVNLAYNVAPQAG